MRVAAGVGDELRWIDTRVGMGLVFHPGRRVDFLLGWRVGDTYATGKIGGAPFSLNLLAADLVPRLSVAMWPRWSMRATPLAPTLYWHHVYSGALALELGVEHAL